MDYSAMHFRNFKLFLKWSVKLISAFIRCELTFSAPFPSCHSLYLTIYHMSKAISIVM